MICFCKQNPCIERDRESAAILNAEFKNPYVDGIALSPKKHPFWPEKKWYQKIWLWFKYRFHRPRFSANAIEPAEKQIGRLMSEILIRGRETSIAHFKENFNKNIINYKGILKVRKTIKCIACEKKDGRMHTCQNYR